MGSGITKLQLCVPTSTIIEAWEAVICIFSVKIYAAAGQINQHCIDAAKIFQRMTDNVFVTRVSDVERCYTLSSIDKTTWSPLGRPPQPRYLYCHNSPSHNYRVLYISLSLSIVFHLPFSLSRSLSRLLSFAFLNRGYADVYPRHAGIERVSSILRHLVNNRNNILSSIRDTGLTATCDDDW